VLDLLRHRANVDLELAALLVGSADGRAVDRQAIIELLEAVLEATEGAALFRELLLECLHRGVHRRQLFQRADLVRIAQPSAPLNSVS